MKKKLFYGCSTALVTPFKSDLSIDYETLEQLIERQIEAKIPALTILGTTSEYPTLTDEEQIELVKFIVRVVNKRCLLICGVGRNDTLHAYHFASVVEKLGVDCLLIVTPYYNKTSSSGLIQHFTFLADRLTLPILLYNVPGRTGMSIPLSVYKTLAKHPQIIGTKEASGDLSLIMQIKASIPDFLIYSGNDDQLIPVLALGGDGVISVVSNLYPKVFHKICLDYPANHQLALQTALELLEVTNLMMVETNPIPVKHSLAYYGFIQEFFRLPLVPLSGANAAILDPILIKSRKFLGE